MGLSEGLRISAVRTFGTGFDICEVGRIDILDAGEIRPVFCGCLSIPTNSEARLERFGRFAVRIDWKIVSIISRQRGRATKRQMSFVSDKADGYFVNSPLEWGIEVLLGNMFGHKGLEIRYSRYARSFGDLIGCVRKFADSDFELFWGRNIVGWVDKGLGGLEKNPRYFKGERKKEDKKEGYT